MENFGRKWNFDRIISTKFLKCFWTNWYRKRRKTFKICCLGRIFCTADRLKQIKKKNKPIEGKSFMEESVVFAFPYQTNENHTMEPSRVGHVIFRTALEKYFRLHWNCKQLRVEARNSMPNCQIYFSISSETIHTNLKIFSQHGFRK